MGSRGPATLENYQFIEKIAHFDRERVPERVVHARGFVAHGEFEAYGSDGQMAHGVDGTGTNPHVNYEPSSTGGLQEAEPAGVPYEPEVSGRLTRATLGRTNDYAQAGSRYRTMPGWEREDLVRNLTDLIGQCDQQIRERMVWHFAQCDPEFGRRVAGGIGVEVPNEVSAGGA